MDIRIQINHNVFISLPHISVTVDIGMELDNIRISDIDKSQHWTPLIQTNCISFPCTKKLPIPICCTPLSHFLSQARRSHTLLPFIFSHLTAVAAAWLMTAGHFGAVTNYSWEDGTGFEKIVLVAHVFSIPGQIMVNLREVSTLSVGVSERLKG